jgi:hypothetical protein
MHLHWNLQKSVWMKELLNKKKSLNALYLPNPHALIKECLFATNVHAINHTTGQDQHCIQQMPIVNTWFGLAATASLYFSLPHNSLWSPPLLGRLQWTPQWNFQERKYFQPTIVEVYRIPLDLTIIPQQVHNHSITANICLTAKDSEAAQIGLLTITMPHRESFQRVTRCMSKPSPEQRGNNPRST